MIVRDIDAFAILGALILFGVVLGSRKALGYVKGQPVELELGSIGGGLWLRADAAAAFNAMRAAAAQDGVNIAPSPEAGKDAAFREVEQQQGLKSEGSIFAAAVGYSPHQGGIALDAETDGGTNAAFRWFQNNGHRFKWVCPYPTKEPWHWEFRP